MFFDRRADPFEPFVEATLLKKLEGFGDGGKVARRLRGRRRRRARLAADKKREEEPDPSAKHGTISQ
jgi:hypothetical protein